MKVWQSKKQYNRIQFQRKHVGVSVAESVTFVTSLSVFCNSPYLFIIFRFVKVKTVSFTYKNAYKRLQAFIKNNMGLGSLPGLAQVTCGL